MKTRTDFLRGLLATVALGLAAAPGWGYTFILNDTTGLPLRWPEGSIPIKIMLGTDKTLSDGGTYDSSVRAAADRWNLELGSAKFQATTATGTALDNNSTNEVVFAAKAFDKDFGEDVLAITTAWYAGNRRVEGDILFNTTDTTWDSYRGPQRRSGWDIQRVALHELGHMLGLDHPDDANQHQDAIMNSHTSDRDTISADDIAGVVTLYGPPGSPANDNFSSAATLSLTGATLATDGYNTNATKESGEPNHAGNIGGHSVWWRWQAPNMYGDATFDTKGSYADTLLAVYTGASVSALTEVASNDDINRGIVQASSLVIHASPNALYWVAVDGFNNSDNKGADSARLTLNLAFAAAAGVAPTITTQPAAATADSGGSAIFKVAAAGSAPFTYQWLFNGTAVSGATNASYGITSATTAQAGTYSVTVTNGIGSVTSQGAALTVNPPLVVVTPPAPPVSSGGGGGGGGGAPSLWFIAALSALGLGRLLRPAGGPSSREAAGKP